jgi:hypothetical protein
LLLLCGRQSVGGSGDVPDAADVFDFELEGHQQQQLSMATGDRYWNMSCSPDVMPASIKRTAGNADTPSPIASKPITPGSYLRQASVSSVDGVEANDSYRTPLRQQAGASMDRCESPLENRTSHNANITTWLANTVTATPPPTVGGNNAGFNGLHGPNTILLPAFPLTPGSPSRGNLASPFKEKHDSPTMQQNTAFTVPNIKFGALHRVSSPLSDQGSSGAPRAVTTDEVVNFTSQRKRDSLLKKRGLRHDRN